MALCNVLLTHPVQYVDHACPGRQAGPHMELDPGDVLEWDELDPDVLDITQLFSRNISGLTRLVTNENVLSEKPRTVLTHWKQQEQ